MNKIELSKVNEEGYYEIRLESVGGLGANLCGKLLGELGAAYLGFNASSFSSYGSEKRGLQSRRLFVIVMKIKKLLLILPLRDPICLGFFMKR